MQCNHCESFNCNSPLTNMPVPMRYYRPEFLRHALRDSKRTAISLMKQLFGVGRTEMPTVGARKDDIFHDPGISRVIKMEAGFTETECNVCGISTPLHLQYKGCEGCRLARLYSLSETGDQIPAQSEEDIYRAYLTGTTKHVESLTDAELNTFLTRIISVQSVIDVARRKARLAQGAAEKEIVKRSPKTKLKAAVVASGTSEPKQRETKEVKAAKAIEALGIDLNDMMNFFKAKKQGN